MNAVRTFCSHSCRVDHSLSDALLEA
jgi:hypothetical protein